MKLLVTDTNVFFDIMSIGALSDFFKLEFDICTTDFVINEVIRIEPKEEIDKLVRKYSSEG
jgi:hypothetical protein